MDYASGNSTNSASAFAEEIDLEELRLEFEGKFGSDQACLEELCRLVEANYSQCKICHSSDLVISESGRAGHCISCSETTWFTAGTILERLKMPKPRLAKIWLEERGVSLSSKGFARLLKISDSSSHGIKVWFDTILLAFFAETDLARPSLFSSAICKRSFQTDALADPKDEIGKMEAEKEEPSSSAATENPDAPLESATDSVSFLFPYHEEEQKVVLDLITAQKEIHYDRLWNITQLDDGLLSGVLGFLEMQGLITRPFGNYYKPSIPKQPCTPLAPETHAFISSFIKFVRTTHHGISLKYLQGYVAAFWYQTNRLRLPLRKIIAETINKNPPIINSREYVRLPFVRVPL